MEFTVDTLTTMDSRLNRELTIRGVSKIEQMSVVDINIPVLPVRPAVQLGEADKFLESTRETLEELNIPENKLIRAQTHTISFIENLQKDVIGPVRTNEQKLRVVSFCSPDRVSEDNKKDGVPLVIFSHGGKIHKDVIGSSGYLPSIYENNPNMILLAMNHRGSESHDAKVDYSLDDKVTDVLVTLKFAKEKLIQELEAKGVKWNGKVILFGDSMGGEVSTVAANIIKADGLILTEPAAYPNAAHFVDFGKRSDKEPVFGGPQGIINTQYYIDSHGFDSIRSYSKTSNENILIVRMKNDNVVRKVPIAYTEFAKIKGKDRIEVLDVDGKHGSTTSEEVIKINEFIQNI